MKEELQQVPVEHQDPLFLQLGRQLNDRFAETSPFHCFRSKLDMASPTSHYEEGNELSVAIRNSQTSPEERNHSTNRDYIVSRNAIDVESSAHQLTPADQMQHGSPGAELQHKLLSSHPLMQAATPAVGMSSSQDPPPTSQTQSDVITGLQQLFSSLPKEEQQDEINSMTVLNIREYLKPFGKSTHGRKEELVNRLLDMLEYLQIGLHHQPPGINANAQRAVAFSTPTTARANERPSSIKKRRKRTRNEALGPSHVTSPSEARSELEVLRNSTPRRSKPRMNQEDGVLAYIQRVEGSDHVLFQRQEAAINPLKRRRSSISGSSIKQFNYLPAKDQLSQLHMRNESGVEEYQAVLQQMKLEASKTKMEIYKSRAEAVAILLRVEQQVNDQQQHSSSDDEITRRNNRLHYVRNALDALFAGISSSVPTE